MGETFRPGDRVEMTEAGLRQGLDGPRRARTGLVVAARPDGVRVRRDGLKTAYWYGPSLWRVGSEPAPFSPEWLAARALSALIVRG